MKDENNKEAEITYKGALTSRDITKLQEIESYYGEENVWIDIRYDMIYRGKPLEVIIFEMHHDMLIECVSNPELSSIISGT